MYFICFPCVTFSQIKFITAMASISCLFIKFQPHSYTYLSCGISFIPRKILGFLLSQYCMHLILCLSPCCLFRFFSKPLEPDSLFNCLPNSLKPSADHQGNQGDRNLRASSASNSAEHRKNDSNTLTYKPATLISPRILPLLHELAQQMFQAGHRQQCFKIYRQVAFAT